MRNPIRLDWTHLIRWPLRTKQDRQARANARANARAAVQARPSPIICLCLGLFAAFLILLLPDRPFAVFDAKVHDQFLRMRNALHPRPVSSRILIIGIDGRDHYLFDEELRSRWAYAALLQTLRDYEPESVLFDILFLSPRRHDELFGATLNDVPSFLAANFSTKPFERQPAAAIPEDLAPLRERLNKPIPAAEIWNTIDSLGDYKEQLEQMREEIRSRMDFQASRLTEIDVRLAWLRFLADRYVESYYTASTSLAFQSSTAELDPFSAEALELPSAPLMRTAAGAGAITIHKSGDEIVRRVPLIHAYCNRLYPSLDLLAVLHHYGSEFGECRIRAGRSIEFPIHKNGAGVKRIPIDSRGQFLVNFRQGRDYISRATHKTLSYYIHTQYASQRPARVLRANLKGAIVLVGETAVGTTDVQPIPLDDSFPLIGVHACVIDNILKDDYLRHAPGWVGLVAVLGFGLVLAHFFAWRDSREAGRIAIGLLILYALGQVALFFHIETLLMPIARPLGAGIGAFFLLTLYVVGVTERDRRLVKDVFLKSVSPRIGEEILRRFHDPSLWASRRAVTVLFVDIRGFTPLSERLAPEALVAMLDSYYDTVSEIVFRHDGQVNKFIGDAVMALFGALPGEGEDHALRALRAAIEIQHSMRQVAIPAETSAHSADAASSDAAASQANPASDSASAVQPPPKGLFVGVGLCTGEVVVGTVGRKKIRIEYTALGDVVNTAERLQGRAPGGCIYASGATIDSARSAAHLDLASLCAIQRVEGLVLKGKTQEVEVFDVRPRSDDLLSAESKAIF